MANRRRAHGEGKLETAQRKSGKRYRVVLTVDKETVVGPWMKNKGEALPAAKKKAAPAAKSSPSFATEFARLLPSLKTLAPSNYDQYETTYEHFARTSLGERPVSAIVASDVLEALATHPGSPATARGHKTRICAVLRRLDNKIKLDNPKSPRKRKITDTDTEGFVKFAKTLRELDCLLLLVSRLTGMNRSEACGLRHSDRDEDGVWIVRGVTRGRDAVHEREILKTARRWGWQPIPKELQSLVGPPKQGYVLTGTAEPLNPGTATKRTQKLLKGTKWEGFGPQASRRSFGQSSYDRDRDVYGTAVLMRHSVEMSEREYLQTDKDLKRSLLNGTKKGTATQFRKQK